MPHPPQLDALLAETRWLSGLARRVVGGHDAEDLVQDTLHTACERPPAADRPLRGWLRSVLLSRFHDARRSDRARATREQRFARDHFEPAAVEVVAKAEVHRRLVEAVLALDEPYRTTVLLRFFENLPPRAIARRLSVPVATVHSRLQRALGHLRRHFEAADGRNWPLALAPLLPRAGLAPIVLGVSLMNAFGKLVLLLGVVATAWFVWPGEATSPSTAPSTAHAATGTPAPATSVDLASQRGSDAVERTDAAPSRPVGPAAADGASPSLRGRVIDVTGVPVPGVALAAGNRANGPKLATSDRAGGFAIDAAPDAPTIVAADTRWATVLAGSARIRPDNRCTVVVAPRIELGGRVVDTGGQPVGGAAVEVHMPQHLGADLGILLDYSVARTWHALCDTDGRFRIADVPAVADGRLTASLGGYLPRFEPLPAASTDLLELVLERPTAGTRLIAGIVVDAWGATVRDARVSVGDAVSRTDAGGEFVIDLSSDRRLHRIVAVAAGAQPAVWVPERSADGAIVWPARVVLQLGPSPLAIRGTVVDADDRPREGVRVWIADPLFVGVEDDVLLAETLLGRDDRPFWAFVLTGGDGAFELRGLADRAYQLRALDPTTLVATTADGVAAGSDGVRLRLAQATHPELRGRVVARDGTPIPDVRVNLQRPALEVEVPGGTRDEWAAGRSVRTDENGGFVFRDVPADGVEVFAMGDSIQFGGRLLEPGIDPLRFDVVVDRRMHLQVELAPPVDRATHARVLDAGGKAMLLRVMRGESAHTSRSARILDGRSEILSLGEGAVTVVFLRDEVEVGRMPVTLAAGEVNIVRF